MQGHLNVKKKGDGKLLERLQFIPLPHRHIRFQCNHSIYSKLIKYFWFYIIKYSLSRKIFYMIFADFKDRRPKRREQIFLWTFDLFLTFDQHRNKFNLLDKLNFNAQNAIILESDLYSRICNVWKAKVRRCYKHYLNTKITVFLGYDALLIGRLVQTFLSYLRQLSSG